MKVFLEQNIIVSKFSGAMYVKPGTGSLFHRKRPYYGFAMSCGGDMRYIFGEKTAFHMYENDIIFFAKFSDYDIEVIDPKGCYAINFDVPEGQELKLDSFVFSPKNPAYFMKHFKNAEDLQRRKPAGYYEKMCADIYNIIGGIKSEMSAEYMHSGKEQIIAPALKFIDENYLSSKIRVSELASLCGVSEVYFRRIFQRKFAMTPVRYVTLRKITRAAELMDSRLYTLSEIAEMAGFEEYSYFSREFKIIYGVSPKSYEKSLSEEKSSLIKNNLFLH